MSDECRNDCALPWVFPRQLLNRPALDRIDYRIGTYADFRRALLSALNQDVLLCDWTHREADDPGIALLEGASILGDILTFYQELYANEAYLRTAHWRESVADLVRLLGYRLSPGVGGRATFAFEVKGDKPVVIPKGFPVKAKLEGIDKPVDFETRDEATAYPALSRFHLYRPTELSELGKGTKAFSTETEVLNQKGVSLNQGDRLMLVNFPGYESTPRQISRVASVRTRFDRTEVTIEGGWHGSVIGNRLTAYKIGRSFRHFGYNAPPKMIVGSGHFVHSDDVPFGKEPRRSILLDQQVDDLGPGTTMLVSLYLDSQDPEKGSTPQWSSIELLLFEREIVQVSSTSATVGAMTGGATLVKFDADLKLPYASGEDLKYTDIRTVEIHEVIGERFPLSGILIPASASDCSRLYFYSDFDSYTKMKDRHILLTHDDKVAEAVATINSDMQDDGKTRFRPIGVSPVPKEFSLDDFPLDNPPVTVYGNLIEANQGKTEKEVVLGNGDNREIFQTFRLPKSPLTYFRSEEDTPPESPELEVFVNDRRWTRVASFFGHGPKEEIYVVREDVEGSSWVQFGDGKTGARLPTGYQNVVARYRTGIGAFGPLKKEATVQAGARLYHLKKIQLPGVASGGDAPETAENARAAAPGKIQSLGRLVSLGDFETEALAIPGVSKVAARWELHNHIPSAVVTVLMEGGRKAEISEVQKILNKANQERGARRFPVMVLPGVRQYVYLTVTAAYGPSFRKAQLDVSIKQALGVAGEVGSGIDGSDGLFGTRWRRFGQPEYATRIQGTIQNIEGVLWARVNHLGFLEGEGDDPLDLCEPRVLVFSERILCDPASEVPAAQVLLGLHADNFHLNLTEAGVMEVPLDE